MARWAQQSAFGLILPLATAVCRLYSGLSCLKFMVAPMKFQHKTSNHQKNCARQQVDFRRILAKSPNPLSKG